MVTFFGQLDNTPAGPANAFDCGRVNELDTELFGDIHLT